MLRLNGDLMRKKLDEAIDLITRAEEKLVYKKNEKKIAEKDRS